MAIEVRQAVSWQLTVLEATLREGDKEFYEEQEAQATGALAKYLPELKESKKSRKSLPY